MIGISARDVRDVLVYDPTSGNFTRAVEKRCGKNNAVVRYRVGDSAGGVNSNGYVRIAVNGKFYYAHRLAYAYVVGEWPTEDIDHINGNRADNRWENLRPASRSMNAQNKKKASKNNKSGLLGSHKSQGKWAARICINGEVRVIGRFETPELAHAAYLKEKRRLHPGCTI